MVQFATENFPRFISDEKADMLREAAFHKSTEEFRALLQGLSGKEYADIAVDNILYKALETDNVDVVRAIVDAKHTDTFQYSRLILRAASELAKKCISLFLDRVANLNEQTDNIRPPGWA